MTITELYEAPLLGTSADVGQRELALAARFDRLHQLLYTKGGVRPTNAAIEEVGKLLFLRLLDTRGIEVAAGEFTLAHVFNGQVPDAKLISVTKELFSNALQVDDFYMRDADGGRHPLWPVDEPFRLANADVLREAVGVAIEAVGGSTSVGDPMGTAFDAFLSGRYDHAGGLGTYLTPSSVARAMAEIAFSIADPLDGWDQTTPVILDPFCGTGRFLIAAFDVASDRPRMPSATLKALLESGLAGADQSSSAIAKTALNLMLYGANHPRMSVVTDSMTDAHLDHLQGKVRLILTNPPFGGGKYSDPVGMQRTRATFTLRGKSTDPALAGLARCLNLLAPGGVLGIVLPDGLLGGRAFGELLGDDSYSIAAVISLPTATFALSGTVAKTSAVFIQKSASRSRTVLSRVEHVGFMKQAGRAVADPEGNQLTTIGDLVSLALASQSVDLGVATFSSAPLVASVPRSGLASVDPSRLDPGAIEGRSRLIAENGIELRELLAVAPRAGTAKRRVRTHEPFVSVLHVDQLGTVSWNEAHDYFPSTPGQWARSGDILISLLNPSKLRAAVVPDDYPEVMCSQEFGVFRPSVDAYALLALLYDPRVQAQLRPLGAGTSSSRRRIAEEDVLSLVVPNKSAGELTRLGFASREAVRDIEKSRIRLAELQQLGI